MAAVKTRGLSLAIAGLALSGCTVLRPDAKWQGRSVDEVTRTNAGGESEAPYWTVREDVPEAVTTVAPAAEPAGVAEPVLASAAASEPEPAIEPEPAEDAAPSPEPAVVIAPLTAAVTEPNPGAAPTAVPANSTVVAPIEIPYGLAKALQSPGLSDEAALWLKEVEVSPSDGGTTEVRLVGEGEFLYQIFRLHGPERLVVDLPQVINLVSRPSLDGSGLVSVARSSQLKIEPVPVSRVALELSSAAEVSISSDAQGLSVFLAEPGAYAARHGSAPAVADVAPLPHPAEVPAPTPAAGERPEAEEMAEVAEKEGVGAEREVDQVEVLATAEQELAELIGELDAERDLDPEIAALLSPDPPAPAASAPGVLADVIPDTGWTQPTAPVADPTPSAPSVVGYGMRGALWGPEPSGDPSTRMLSVDVTRGDDVELVIRGDGEFSWVAFRLEEPHRLVVDLFGVRHAASLAAHDIGRGGVAAYRSSQFKRQPEAVSRVVIDLEDRLDVHIEGDASGLAVRLLGPSPR